MVGATDDGSPNKGQEVSCVLGHDRPPLGRHPREEVGVTHSAEVGPLPSRRDIVPALPEVHGNPRREVLVEEQLHSRTACSRRHAS